MSKGFVNRENRASALSTEFPREANRHESQVLIVYEARRLDYALPFCRFIFDVGSSFRVRTATRIKAEEGETFPDIRLTQDVVDFGV